MANIASAELLVRQLQLIEQKHAERLPGSSEDGDSGMHLFLGTSNTRGGICVAPSLSEYIAEEAKKESAVLKEQRKAREERSLARKNAK
eukprot:7918184-Karenia_brevis.AAC.1